MYTSLKLSKLLAENGCKIKNEKQWENHCEKDHPNRDACWRFSGYFEYQDKYIRWTKELIEYIPSYELLWDICIKHAKEFFVKEGEQNFVPAITMAIFELIQQNKIQEAEDFFWKHTIFNPANR